jgi:hypothetical protein
MNLPVYQNINVRSIHLEDLQNMLTDELNLRHPVALNLKHLDLDQQREIIGIVENFFVTHNLSYKFPYPIYLITDHEATITQMPTVRIQEELPRFFVHKDTRMNVKEAHLSEKNRLLQQEIKNSDAAEVYSNIAKYSANHRQIFMLEEEKMFYQGIAKELMKAKNG